MPRTRRKVRYRGDPATLSTLQKDVRDLTSEIRSARQELLDELQDRRRSDLQPERTASGKPEREADGGGDPEAKPAHLSR